MSLFMDITTLLIIGQIALVLLAGNVFLGLYARRQKKIVEHLQSILLEYQADMSGDTLVRYLQLSLDDTTAHCGQDTIALKPDAEPDQMAISLRHHALAAELAQVQSYNGELSPWKTAIAPYVELAQTIHEHIQGIPESVKAQLIPKIDNLENQLAEAKSLYEQTKNHLDNYKQLEGVYKEAGKDDVDKQQLEIQLHHALLALTENIENVESLREVIYLMHEGYLNAKDNPPSELAPIEQTALEQPESAENSEEEDEYDKEEMYKLIEQFTEESAELVERIYMLNNENKKLSTENEELRAQIKSYTNAEVNEESVPIVEGLKMKLESQMEEIMRLQTNAKQLEEKYLALYSEKYGQAPPESDIARPLPEESTAQASTPEAAFNDEQQPVTEDTGNSSEPTAPEHEPPTLETEDAVPTEETEMESDDNMIDPDAILAEMNAIAPDKTEEDKTK